MTFRRTRRIWFFQQRRYLDRGWGVGHWSFQAQRPLLEILWSRVRPMAGP